MYYKIYIYISFTTHIYVLIGTIMKESRLEK